MARFVTVLRGFDPPIEVATAHRTLDKQTGVVTKSDGAPVKAFGLFCFLCYHCALQYSGAVTGHPQRRSFKPKMQRNAAAAGEGL